MIKVLASNAKQAVEIVEAFKNSSADVVIEVKENTATVNSDVYIKQIDINKPEYHYTISKIMGIIISQNYSYSEAHSVLRQVDKTLAERSYHITTDYSKIIEKG